MKERLAKIKSLLAAGNVDAAVEGRKSLLDDCCAMKPLVDPESARTKGLLASLSLVLLKVDEALSVLSPYVSDECFQEAVVENLRQISPASAILIASVSADALYRGHAHEESQKAIDWAMKWMPARGIEAAQQLSGADPSEREDVLALYFRTLARAARIAWRKSHRGEAAEAHLRKCFAELDVVGGNLSQQQRRSIESYALDIWASFDWTEGRHHEARGKIYRALHLLEGTQDSSRKAHALLSAAKIESSFVTDVRFQNAVALLDEAYSIIHPEHILRPQILIQKALTLTKCGKLTDAFAVLTDVETTDFVQLADKHICLIWIHRRQQSFELAEKEARKLKKAIANAKHPYPRRVVIEADLQLGAVLIEQNQYAVREKFNEAMECLRNALAMAEQFHRRKLAAAAHIEFVNAYQLNLPGDVRVATHVQQARLLMADLKSAYLESRLREVTRNLNLGWLHHVVDDNYGTAMERFEEALLLRTIPLAREADGNINISEMARLLKLDRRTIITLLNKHSIKRPTFSPTRRKRP